MTHLHLLESSTNIDQAALSSLLRTINLSQGHFSLILVSCNDATLQQQVSQQIYKSSAVPIQELTLTPSSQNLFTTIYTTLQSSLSQLPSVLMISGLDTVKNIEELLLATNLARDAFRKHCPFPLIIWINDAIAPKLRKFAPDFRSWASNPIRFDSLTPSPRSAQTSSSVLPLPSSPVISLQILGNPPPQPSFLSGNSEQWVTPILPAGVESEKRPDWIAMLNVDYGVPEVVIMEPNSFTEIPPYIDVLRARKSMILNLTRMHPDEAQRAVDFLAGGTYALDGDQKRVGNSVFLFTPSCVVLTTELNTYQPMTA